MLLRHEATSGASSPTESLVPSSVKGRPARATGVPGPVVAAKYPLPSDFVGWAGRTCSLSHLLTRPFILLAVAYGLDEVKRRFSIKALTVMTSAGVFLYAGIGLLCLLLGENFLDYGVLPVVEPRGMGMLGIEIGVGITVMAALISIFHDLLDFE